MGLFGGSSLYDTAWAAFDAVQAERQAKEAFLKEGMTEEEVLQESSRCLRCDHYGYGNFRGGRMRQW